MNAGRGGRGRGRGYSGRGRGRGRGGYDWRNKRIRTSEDSVVQGGNMRRNGSGNGRGSGSGRGYDWRKHVRPSADPTVQNDVREEIQSFLESGSMKREVRCGGEEKNTYKQYCKQMGVGWVKGGKGSYKMIRLVSANPSLTLWKKVWCFYFSHYCDVDLVAEAEKNAEVKDEVNSSAGDAMDIADDDKDEAAAISLLLQNDDDDNDDGIKDDSEAESKSKITLDSTSNTLDGKRMWAKVRDLLSSIKQNDAQLWEECCSLGVNNCSERKLEPQMEQVQKFFDLQGRGPNQKIRGKKLQVEVGSDESVHFLGDDNISNPIEYAKPVRYRNTAAIKRLIQLVDKANHGLGSGNGSDSNGEEHLPLNAFNDNWRKRRRNFELGERLHKDNMDPIYQERKNSLRGRLPAFKVGGEFCKRVFENDVVVLCGATGSGKTTQLPQILMEEAAKLMHEQQSGLMENGKKSFGTGRIICTQPRRISATSIAERVCFERNEKMGGRVGYQIRFEAKASDTTELLYVTTGILLRFLVLNPKLEGVSCVIIDEAHERSVHNDFVLLILKDLILERQGTNEPLRVVLMSATIDATNFIQYFDPDSSIKIDSMSTSICDGNTATSCAPSANQYSVSFVQIEGKTNYPIEEYFLEDLCQEIPSLAVSGPPPMSGRGRNKGLTQRNSWASTDAVKAKYSELGLQVKNDDKRVWRAISNSLQRPFQLDADLICQVVEHIETKEAIASELDNDGTLGSILIFVPGWQEITAVIKELEKTLKDCRRQHSWARHRSWNILPLHSMVPQKEQMRIFDPEVPHSGRRKIIVSTILAETSVTVEDVVYVIDPGLTKSTTYSAHTNIASLETLQISRSNVQQRRGRAGRCQSGHFYKLYSQYEFHHEMRDHELPEMLRTPVEELCLQAKALRLPGDLPVQQILEKAINPPESVAVENAVQLLTELGAFDMDEKMTPLGWKLSHLPVHPSLGKMLLLGSLFTRYSSDSTSHGQNSIQPLISVCSTLSFKSPFVLPLGKEKEADCARKNYGQGLLSDHFLFAKVSKEYQEHMKQRSGYKFSQWLNKHFLSKKTLEMTEKIQQDLHRYLSAAHSKADLVGHDNGRQNDMEEALSRPLLSAILAASLSISFTSPTRPKLCSLRGGSACSIHPSSLLSMIECAGNERMLWRKYKHLLQNQNNDMIVEEFVLDCPDKIFIVGWFERLQTTELYLRDCTLFSDPLPLLLFLPGVKQRGISKSQKSQKESSRSDSFADDVTIFEVMGGKSSEGGDSHKHERKSDTQQPMLLLKVQDEITAELLSSLREKLAVFFSAILSTGADCRSMEDDIQAVFLGLKYLIEESDSLYLTKVGGIKMDPDVLEVRHLHNSADCEILDSSHEEGDDEREIGLDDDINYYGNVSNETASSVSGGRHRNSNWHEGRGGRSNRRRGKQWGYGGAKSSKGW